MTSIVEIKPWLLDVWELLDTKAPCPDKCQPYCCYMQTVIFYHRPYIVRPWSHLWNCNGKLRAEKPGRHYEEWGRCETTLTWDTPVEYNGERFLIGGGTVVWKNRRWWMRHRARREAATRSNSMPKNCQTETAENEQPHV